MSEKLPITVLVQTKNEQLGIGVCLDGLSDFAEIIVVDSNSEDQTAAIARSKGCQVVNFSWNGQYPKKKQWQLENVSTRFNWVMFIDADEVPSADLISELRHIFPPSSTVAAVDVDLVYVFAGRALHHGHTVTKRCIVNKDRVRFPVVDDLQAPGMGELEGHYQPLATGKVLKARSRLVHNDLDPVSSWFARHNKYSDWEAHLRSNADVKADVARRRTLKGRLFDTIPCKPLIFFIYSYIIRAGFLDGRAGFDYAFALAAYYWQIGLKTRELSRNANRL